MLAAHVRHLLTKLRAIDFEAWFSGFFSLDELATGPLVLPCECKSSDGIDFRTDWFSKRLSTFFRPYCSAVGKPIVAPQPNSVSVQPGCKALKVNFAGYMRFGRVFA